MWAWRGYTTYPGPSRAKAYRGGHTPAGIALATSWQGPQLSSPPPKGLPQMGTSAPGRAVPQTAGPGQSHDNEFLRTTFPGGLGTIVSILPEITQPWLALGSLLSIHPDISTTKG